MLTQRWLIALTGLFALLGACSSSDHPGGLGDSYPLSDGGQSGSDAALSFCGSYCQSIVSRGTGCETYNADGRCYLNCRFYDEGPCHDSWRAFAQCEVDSPELECVMPDGARNLAVVAQCPDTFATWNQCSEQNDAGVCPY